MIYKEDGTAEGVTKKNGRANAVKEVERLCKVFGFTARMLKGLLAESRKSK